MPRNLYENIKNNSVIPKKSLGQNFLIDRNITNKIVSMIPNISEKHILEIGPGVASLSLPILEKSPKQFSCIEFDKRCVTFLTENIAPHFSNMSIFHANALEFDETILSDHSKLTLIANLPYNIASVLLVKWLEKIYLFDKLVLMFQKEVAERICAPVNTKKYGILSVLSQYLCKCHIEFNISPNCFYPPPKVSSSIVVLEPKNNVTDLLESFMPLKNLVKILFNTRRKTIYNNLKKIRPTPETTLEQAKINKNLRPENLSIDDFIKLTKILGN